MELLAIALKAIVLLAAGIAALLWVRAAKAEVEPQPDSTVVVDLGGHKVDLPRTMALQGQKNRRAANATAYAFIFQTIEYSILNWPF